MDVHHDLFQTLLGVLETPGVAAGVLLHLQGAGCHAAGVGRLAGPERNACVHEHVNPLGCGRHVGAFGDRDTAIFDQHLGILGGQLVLGGAWQRDLARHVPDTAVLKIGRACPLLDVGTETTTLDLLDLLEQSQIDPVLVDHDTVGIGAGDHARTECLRLFDGVDGDVARARDHAGLTLDRIAADLEHLLQEEDGPVARGLGARTAAAPVQSLAGEDARLVAVGDALVLAEKIADLAPADTDIARRYVGVLADVAIELRHEALAKTHDLGVRLALGVEVAAALAAADRHTGQRVLEDLLEAEEFDDPQIHRRVEPHAALVGTERAVELDPKGAVDLDLAAVVLPGHAEDDLTLRLADALDDLLLRQLRILDQDRTECVQHLAYRLMKLGLAGIAAQHILKNRLQLFVEACNHGECLQNRFSRPIDRQAIQISGGDPGSETPLSCDCDTKHL